MLMNSVFISVIASSILSQGIKVVRNSVADKRLLSLQDMIVTGGMPSTHSAMVSALFSIMILETGMSNLTTVCFVIFLIVITDSFGVRRTAGEEGRVIEKISEKIHYRLGRHHFSLGHTPIQVLAGISIGVFVSLLVFFTVG